MAVNQFEVPLQHQPQQTYVSQYVPLPFEQMARKVQEDQTALDTSKQKTNEFLNSMALARLDVDADVVNSQIQSINKSISSSIDEAGGDYRKVMGTVAQGANQWKQFVEMGPGEAITHRVKARDEYEKTLDKSDVGSEWNRILKTASTKGDASHGGVKGLGRDLYTLAPWKVDDYRKSAIDAVMKKISDVTDWIEDKDTGNYIVTRGEVREELSAKDVNSLAYGHLYANEDYLNMVKTKYTALHILKDGIFDEDTGDEVTFKDYLQVHAASTLDGIEDYAYLKTKDIHKLKATALGDKKKLDQYELGVEFSMSTIVPFQPTSNVFDGLLDIEASDSELLTKFNESTKAYANNFLTGVYSEWGDGKNRDKDQFTAQVMKLYPDPKVKTNRQEELVMDMATGGYTWDTYRSVIEDDATAAIFGITEKEFTQAQAQAKQAMISTQNAFLVYDEVFRTLKANKSFTEEQVKAWQNHIDRQLNDNIPYSQKGHFIPEVKKASYFQNNTKNINQNLTKYIESATGKEVESPTKEEIALSEVWKKIEGETTTKRMVKARSELYSKPSKQTATTVQGFKQPGKEQAESIKDWRKLLADTYVTLPTFYEDVKFQSFNADGNELEEHTLRELAIEELSQNEAWVKRYEVADKKLKQAGTTAQPAEMKDIQNEIADKQKELITERMLFQDFYEPGSKNDIAGVFNVAGLDRKMVFSPSAQNSIYSTLFNNIDVQTKAQMVQRQQNMMAEKSMTENVKVDSGIYLKTSDKKIGGGETLSIPFGKDGGSNASYGSQTTHRNIDMIIIPNQLLLPQNMRKALSDTYGSKIELEGSEQQQFRALMIQHQQQFETYGRTSYTSTDNEPVIIDNRDKLNEFLYGVLLPSVLQ